MIELQKDESGKVIMLRIKEKLLGFGVKGNELEELLERFLVLGLYKKNKVDSHEAAELLDMDRDGFLNLLDNMGVVYVDRGKGDDEPRASAVLAMLADDRETMAMLNRELIRINRRLTEAKKVGEEVMSLVSHELRTPLNVLIGYTRLLLNGAGGPLTDEQHEWLTIIHEHSRFLLGLANDVIDLSQIDSGHISLKREWVNVYDVLDEVQHVALSLIEGREVVLKKELAPGLPEVYADRARVRQIILNLLSNAIEATQHGEVTLSAGKTEEEEGEQAHVVFSVTDAGPGIRQEDMPLVFQNFQIDYKTYQKGEYGIGLGLPISLRLAQLHGGRIWAESRVGKGSTFYFSLPVSLPASMQAPRQARRDKQDKTSKSK